MAILLSSKPDNICGFRVVLSKVNKENTTTQVPSP